MPRRARQLVLILPVRASHNRSRVIADQFLDQRQGLGELCAKCNAKICDARSLGRERLRPFGKFSQPLQECVALAHDVAEVAESRLALVAGFETCFLVDSCITLGNLLCENRFNLNNRAGVRVYRELSGKRPCCARCTPGLSAPSVLS
jgi:hypothetical protein